MIDFCLTNSGFVENLHNIANLVRRQKENLPRKELVDLKKCVDRAEKSIFANIWELEKNGYVSITEINTVMQIIASTSELIDDCLGHFN